MKKRITFVAGIVLLALLVAGCGGGPKMEESAAPTEKMLTSSEPNRPEWTMSIPDPDSDGMYFMGMSSIQASEQDAIDNARQHATRQIVNYMGGLVKDDYQRARVSYGLSSDVEDPTTSMKNFERQLAQNMVQRVQVKRQYFEKWQTPTGIGYKYIVLVKIPNTEMEKAYQDTANNMAKQAQQKAREENRTQAKKQLEDAANMWSKMADEGLF